MTAARRWFDEIGEARLRAMVADFYERVFADVMIGFLFVGKDKAHLVDREYEVAARMLGGDVPYRGRPIREAHRHVPILGGQFDRRLELFRQAMVAHDFPAEAQALLHRHNLSLRSQVTADPSSDCNHEQVEGPPPTAAPEHLLSLRRRS